MAQAVLRGETRGYRHHPQLDRFRDHQAPLAAISAYLKGVHLEALVRGYRFDPRKIGPMGSPVSLTVTTGQLEFEWKHLLVKLKARDVAVYRMWRSLGLPEAHPVFDVRPGEVEPWERQ